MTSWFVIVVPALAAFALAKLALHLRRSRDRQEWESHLRSAAAARQVKFSGYDQTKAKIAIARADEETEARRLHAVIRSGVTARPAATVTPIRKVQP
jgi:hypothetical protein